MKHIFKPYFYMLLLAFYPALFQAEGFSAGTLVKVNNHSIPIEQCTINEYIISSTSSSNPIAHIRHSNVDHYIKIGIKNTYIYAAPDQKFYCPNQKIWIVAQELTTTDTLLCYNNRIIAINSIEQIHDPHKMFALSVDTSHTFYVTAHEVIAHNFEPVSTTATAIVTVALACPPAAIGMALTGIVTGGIYAIATYYAHKLSKNNTTTCFPPHDAAVPQDCTMTKAEPIPLHNKPCIELPPPVPLVTTIPLDLNQKKPVDCVFSTIEIKLPVECFQKKNQNDNTTVEEQIKKQYDGPTYHRTEDWIEQHPFGQKIEKSLSRSQYKNQGKRAFRVEEKIDNCNGFNKGDFIVVDAMHKDHLEIFDKRKEWKQVANFDGTKNHKKTEQGEQEKRNPLS